MLRTIVEGEPGIFPNPVAQAMRKIGGLFDRRKSAASGAPHQSGDDQPGTGRPGDDEPGDDRPGDDEPRSDR